MKRYTIILIIFTLFSLLPLGAATLRPETVDAIINALNERGYAVVDENALASVTKEQNDWWDSEIEKAHFSYDVYFRSFKNRGSNFSVGGGLNIGLQTSSFKFELYGLGDYFLKPLGGEGGAASLEYMLEVGGMLAWKFMEVWRTRTYICLDVGYFMQFASIPRAPKDIFMAMNGIMIRPTVKTYFQISKNYDMSLGLFFQTPLYPVYNDYRGVGVIIGIL